MDLCRQPYNSIPATRQQLNSSHPDFAALDPKYACAVLPKQWVAVFFGFELDTRMLATSHEYTQVLYDALDSMARSIEKRLAKPGRTVLVSLGVHDSLYHTVSFRDQLREKSETACLLTQCHRKWFPSAYGWNNEHFVYARRTFESAVSGSFTDYIFSEQFLGLNFLGFNFRLGDGAEPLQSLVDWPFVAPLANEHDARPRTIRRHGPRITSLRRRTMHLNKLQVDGVVISDDVMRKEVRAQGDVLDSFSPTMQISQVEDFDISNVLGFVDPEQNPLKKHTPQDATAVSYCSDSNYLIVVVSISLIITSVLLLVCGRFVRSSSRVARKTSLRDPIHECVLNVCKPQMSIYTQCQACPKRSASTT
jgi:hypothetical protein